MRVCAVRQRVCLFFLFSFRPPTARSFNPATALAPIEPLTAAPTVPPFALHFPLFMNRPGKFAVEVKAEDRVSKKTSSYKLPVTINPAQ